MNWSRMREVWERALRLATPIMGQSVTSKLTRAVDIFVTATFSPAAIVGISLASLYTQFPSRIGLGLGSGAMALSSQDTGAGAAATRDEAVTQALLLGAILGVPFLLAGVLYGEPLIRLIGAAPKAVSLGGQYLAIVALVAPMWHCKRVASKAIGGTGDTRTPMYINVATNLSNVALTIAFGLGVPSLGIPRLGVVGVALATLVDDGVATLLLLLAIRVGSPISYVRPRKLVITRQLVTVSAPSIAAGIVITAAVFPFNTLLLGFGQVVNAGYQVAWRAFSLAVSPVTAGYRTATSIVVGQTIGTGDTREAFRNGLRLVGLGAVTVGTIGLCLVVAARPIAGIFGDDPAVLAHATAFLRVLGLLAVVQVSSNVLSASLQGASETRIPLLARIVGMFGGMVGVTWLVGEYLGHGALGGQAGVAASYTFTLLVLAAGYFGTDWAERAVEMMDERGSM